MLTDGRILLGASVIVPEIDNIANNEELTNYDYLSLESCYFVLAVDCRDLETLVGFDRQKIDVA